MAISKTEKIDTAVSNDKKSMKPNFFRPKDFREDDELVLFGFVHEFESHFEDEFFIPKAIIELIITFYSFVDSWDIKYSPYFNINSTDKSIQRIESYNTYTYSAFGENIIDTQEHDDAIWNFKITAKGTDGRSWTETIIGIINTKLIDNDKDDAMNKKAWTDYTSFGGYGLNTRNGRLLCNSAEGHPYGPCCKETDVICMLFTIKDQKMNGQNTLKFFVNGIDHGYAFTRIPNGSYKLAISMAQPDQIKLF